MKTYKCAGRTPKHHVTFEEAIVRRAAQTPRRKIHSAHHEPMAQIVALEDEWPLPMSRYNDVGTHGCMS
jgi:hypothetical protein